MISTLALWLVISVITLLCAFCLIIILIISKKLKAGKDELKRGWDKYDKYNKWFVRWFFADKLKEGYEQLRTGEKLYKKFLHIRRWLIIILILTALTDLALIGFVLLAK